MTPATEKTPMTDPTTIQTPAARRPAARRPAARRPAARAGFSFAEVLFAVIILGIGFILVAAIFPVAIQQTQTTAEDAAAAAAAREAVSAIAELTAPSGNRYASAPNALTGYAGPIAQLTGATPNPQYTPVPQTALSTPLTPPVGINAVVSLPLFPPTVKNYALPTSSTAGVVPPPAVVAAFSGPRWDAIRGNVILQTDPRYAYVAFYRRENGSPTAQLIVIAMAARNQPTFVNYKLAGTTTPPPYLSDTLPPYTTVGSSGAATLTRQARPDPTTSSITQTTIYPDTVSFNSVPGWLMEGCFIPTNNITTATRTATGRSYRLGRQILGGGAVTYELDSPDDLNAAAGADGLWGTTDDVIDVAGTTPGFAAAGATDSVPPVPQATLQPTVGYAAVFTAAGSLGGRITLAANLSYVVGAGKDNVAPGPAVPGAYVIVADDYAYGATKANPPSNAVKQTIYTLPQNAVAPFPDTHSIPAPPYPNLVVGQYNGRVFKLGQPVPMDLTATPPVYPGTFELDPSTPAPTPTDDAPFAIPTIPNGPWARVYVVGAGRTNVPPNMASGLTENDLNAPANYSGLAQPIGVFTSTVPVP